MFQFFKLFSFSRTEAQGLQPRELGVVFKDLQVQGKGSSDSYQPTIGSMFNPFLIPEKIRQARHPTVRNILTGFEGVVNSGEMLCESFKILYSLLTLLTSLKVVLGRPGAGCSTLLKTLANQHEEYHNVSGLLHYSAFTPKQIKKHFRGDVIYCPEDDIHFPTLTVQETLGFAARTRIPSRDARLQGK